MYAQRNVGYLFSFVCQYLVKGNNSSMNSVPRVAALLSSLMYAVSLKMSLLLWYDVNICKVFQEQGSYLQIKMAQVNEAGH